MRAVIYLLVLVVSAIVRPAGAAVPFEQAFDEVRQLRTADTKAFSEALIRLEARKPEASPLMRERLRVLQAHRMVITGDTAGAIALLKELSGPGMPDPLRFEAGGLLANTYAITREFHDALQTLEFVLPLESSVADRDIRHTVLQSAGIVYNLVGEFRIGLRYAERMLSESPTGRSLCLNGNLVLESRLGLGMTISQQEADDTVRNCEAAGEPILAGFSREYVARWHHGQGRTREALQLLEQGLEPVERAGYPILIGQFHAAIAQYRMALGDRAGAASHARQAVTLLAPHTSLLAIVVAYRVLYEIEEAGDDASATLAAYRQYSDAERAYFNDVKSREMAYQVVRHQSLQQAQQIELLHQKNQLLELQQRVSEQRAQNWLLLALVLIAGMTSVGYWAYKTKRLQVRLKRMTETDALTGISNRQHFSGRAAAALGECARDAEPAVLVMFDLDHFKQVNDRFGHAAGDWALRRVAEAARPLCRNVDVFGRLGGEEFALFLPGLDAAAGIRLAGDVQARFGAIDTGAAGYGFRIAASFGVAAVDSAGYSLATLMHQADQAMYAAKRGGRGQVRVFETAMESDTFEMSPAPIDLLRRGQRDDVTNPAATQPSDTNAQRAIA
ncbi:GGDEF domain-containing protein [Luteimonas terrae]|uniref:diguanylate cyclase n=1 Tax=Luteimonas terrae TaxID=1530191 RepID=A0ABU1XVL1_9GAMM|nr:GGDEF domain-containing protein [Luteimonas terrae]MDR7192794.1 diguanylate cyclase (GGDEF)-like protein [Luteimonas terrae]